VDARHEKRIKLVQNIFALSFDYKNEKFILPNKNLTEETEKLNQNLEKIDSIISTHAPKYPLDKIAKTDLGILRLAVYELLIEQKEPVKVVINEAVELAKELGNDRSYAFINAVLGSIIKEVQHE
jgi:N utilization substance protein B